MLETKTRKHKTSIFRVMFILKLREKENVMYVVPTKSKKMSTLLKRNIMYFYAFVVTWNILCFVCGLSYHIVKINFI